jgi:hypothetical protein
VPVSASEERIRQLRRRGALACTPQPSTTTVRPLVDDVARDSDKRARGRVLKATRATKLSRSRRPLLEPQHLPVPKLPPCASFVSCRLVLVSGGTSPRRISGPPHGACNACVLGAVCLSCDDRSHIATPRILAGTPAIVALLPFPFQAHSTASSGSRRGHCAATVSPGRPHSASRRRLHLFTILALAAGLAVCFRDPWRLSSGFSWNSRSAVHRRLSWDPDQGPCRALTAPPSQKRSFAGRGRLAGAGMRGRITRPRHSEGACPSAR